MCCEITRKHKKIVATATVSILGPLRMTVLLVSYIRNFLRFCYYASLSTCCQNLKKKTGVTGQNLGESGRQTFKGSDREVSILVLWQIPTSGFCFFLVRKINKRNQSDWWEKIHGHRRKTRENDNFLTKQSPSLSPNFIRGLTVIIILIMKNV